MPKKQKKLNVLLIFSKHVVIIQQNREYQVFNYIKYKEIKNLIEKKQKTTKIIAISKNQRKEAILHALEHGVRLFGENRVQEAFEKFNDIKTTYPDMELHLTGPLQTNKVKKALEVFDVFQTLDREKLANEFLKFPDLIIDKKFFIQINTGKEISKGGVFPEKTNEFINYCVHNLKLKVVGLMCIPPINESPKDHFEFLRKIANENNLDEISIGMSGDYLEAVQLNASYIRLGTVLFGKRE